LTKKSTYANEFAKRGNVRRYLLLGREEEGEFAEADMKWRTC